MQALCVAVLVAVTVASVSAGALDLTASTFSSALEKGPHFVKFYAPWCGHCKRLAPTWDELADKHNAEGKVTFAKVDCTVHNDLCKAHSVSGYPTLKFFQNGKSLSYSGGRGADALEKYAFEQLASGEPAKVGDSQPVQRTPEGLYVATEGNFKETIGKGLAFVKFYAPWCGHCKRLAPTWDELAQSFQTSTSVRIVKVDCTAESSVCSEYDIRGYPTLVLFRDGEKVAAYNGGRTLDAFTSFINEHSGAAQPAAAEAGADTVTVEEGLKVLTDTTFDAGVKSGLTLVKFYAPWCGHCKRLAPTWDELAKKFENDKDVAVAKVDCTQFQGVCGKYQVRGYPTLLLFKDGKQVDKYSGGRDLKSLATFLLTAAGRHDEL